MCRSTSAFGDLLLRQLDNSRINVFDELLDKAELSLRYIFDIVNILKAGLEDAVCKGLISQNQAKLTARRSKLAEEARFLTQDELRRFLIAARGEWVEDFFILLLHTGLRGGEALGLPWDAVDLEVARLTVRLAMLEAGGNQILGEPKTQAGRRTMLLPREAVAALKRQRRRQLKAKLQVGPAWDNPHNLVFTNDRGAFSSAPTSTAGTRPGCDS